MNTFCGLLLCTLTLQHCPVMKLLICRIKRSPCRLKAMRHTTHSPAKLFQDVRGKSSFHLIDYNCCNELISRRDLTQMSKLCANGQLERIASLCNIIKYRTCKKVCFFCLFTSAKVCYFWFGGFSVCQAPKDPPQVSKRKIPEGCKLHQGHKNKTETLTEKAQRCNTKILEVVNISVLLWSSETDSMLYQNQM